jgi:hypothetical protein
LISVACCSSEPTIEPNAAASRFVEALNAKNVRGMTALSGTPFRFRNQAWKSAPDGSGFVLGDATEQVAAGAAELDAMLQEVATKVHVAETTPVLRPPSKEQLLGETLRGAPARWADFTLVLFRRGEADVEHIAIVAVDPVSSKVLGLYVN